MPELAVTCCHPHQLSQGNLVVTEGIDAGSHVIHKSNGFDFYLGRPILTLIERTMGLGVIQVKEGAAYEQPVGGGILLPWPVPKSGYAMLCWINSSDAPYFVFK